MNRREFLRCAAGFAAADALSLIAARSAFAEGHAAARRLAMPPVLDTRENGRLSLTAMGGKRSFLGGSAVPTAGYNQDYLGPTIILRNGDLAAEVHNTLQEDISVHWHGLLVRGEHDGSPHLAIAPGAKWNPELTIAQDPATAWYHSHIHRRTAEQVYFGLAGVIHLTDGRDDQRGLPTSYGVDDLTIVLQDRRFDASGRMVYDVGMMDVMHGFAGNRLLVNGQMGATAIVPRGIVRLRLLNGSNARTYTLFLDDTRPMHLAATDGGFLPAPTALDVLRLAPGERAEILVDFAGGGAPVLMSDPGRPFGVLQFATDGASPPRITRLPDELDGALPDLSGAAVRTRQVSLDMGMGGMMMGGGFAINGRPFDMDRIDFDIPLGSVERWHVRSTMLAHPFHVHGVRFRVLSENGAPPRPENTGWKDTVLVTGEAEIVARFDQPAKPETPFMFHCHILEHEDAGMMGQFTVT